jgi:hypothetical protein
MEHHSAVGGAFKSGIGVVKDAQGNRNVDFQKENKLTCKIKSIRLEFEKSC